MRVLLVVLLFLGLAGCSSDSPAGDDPPEPPMLTAPVLPAVSERYADAWFPLPQHFLFAPTGSVLQLDNTPDDNRITDAGATLGRVLFYDVRLSLNNRVACGSCHQQAFGFSDTARFSRGLAGGRTVRHAMSLVNARYYQDGRFFWDERAASLEAQVLVPVQDPVEMGMTLDALVRKLDTVSFYPPLFNLAFGSPEVTSDRIARALAQFVRSLFSSSTPFDSVFLGGGPPDFSRLSPAAQQGRQLFVGPAGCSPCHRTEAQVLDAPRNTGLDAQVIDAGTGQGRFKSPSLRNVAVRAPYMHDGRFQTLEEVVDFYDHGVQPNPFLDSRLRAPDGTPRRLGLTREQRDAVVAYLRSLTDRELLTSRRFANPFPVQ